MKSFNALSNQVSGLTTKTIETFTHRFGLYFSRGGERDLTSVPTKALICNPPSLTAGWSNPHTGLTPRVDNSQSPLCLEFFDITVWDFNRAQRIDYFNRFRLENHFGFDPKEIDGHCKNDRNNQLRDRLGRILQDKERVSGKKRDKHQGNSSQYEIASGAKSFIHSLSIAGDTR